MHQPYFLYTINYHHPDDSAAAAAAVVRYKKAVRQSPP